VVVFASAGGERSCCKNFQLHSHTAFCDVFFASALLAGNEKSLFEELSTWTMDKR